MDAPRDELVRAVFPSTAPDGVPAVGLRSMDPSEDEEGGDAGDTEITQRTLFGHFAVFNAWTEINSWEGCFLERIAPGSFKKTMAEQRDRIKVLYDHGYDPQLGNKPLGPLSELREDSVGGYYEVPLIDTSYNRDFVIPAAEVPGLLGASFRFRVINDSWNNEPGVSTYNPKGLPERTITEVQLYELGPVTFGAYAEACAGLRSRGDSDLWRSLDETGRAEMARLMQRARDLSTPTDPAAAQGALQAADGAAPSTTQEPAVRHSGLTHPERVRVLQINGVLNP